MDIATLRQSYANVFISSSACSLKSEKKFPVALTVAQLKDKLVLMTGCENTTMQLDLLDDSDKLVCKMEDNSKTLKDYGVCDGMHIHATDPTVPIGAYDKVDEPTEDYQISTEEYAKREDTVLAWKRRNKLGQFREVDPETALREEKQRAAKAEEERVAASKLSPGDRCQVHVPGAPTRRGLIRFVGETRFREGLWVGVQYDEPVGRHDGSVEGVRYFSDCPDKYGAFVKPMFVEKGDFPELSIDELDEI